MGDFMKFLAVFLISALMGMGVGGGGLFVIYLTLCLGYEQMMAQGTNLLFFIIAGAFSLFYHFKKRHIIWWQAAIMIIFGTVGSILFSKLALVLDPKYPKIALGILLVTSGLITLFNIIKKAKGKNFKKTLYK